MKSRAIFFLIIVWCTLACRKEDDITTDPNVKLAFSTDSLLFDTVFTTTGSITRRIKVYNRNDRAVEIDEIKLYGGGTSNYQININGIPSHQVKGIKLRGKDSLNVFVKVTINPNSDLSAFIVKDSVGFMTNGNPQRVVLEAYGQNAVFLKDETISSNTTWDSELPYVVYNKVLVNPGQTLTIQQGTRIYFHKGAELTIAGSLKVNGERKDSVTFAGDRLEAIYANEPGQWKGLRFLQSSDGNRINYALIKNATVGLQIDPSTTGPNPKLLLTNTLIQNMELVGLYCINSSVAAFNNIITNCGRHLLYAINGGQYNFKQNTFVNLNFQFSRTTPAVFFTDELSPGKSSAFDLELINNILWGNLPDELIVERKGVSPFAQKIRTNLIKSRDTNLAAGANLLNADPMFKNARQYLFMLSPGSPGQNKGENLSSDPFFILWLNKDFNGKTRLFPSELGCYEL